MSGRLNSNGLRAAKKRARLVSGSEESSVAVRPPSPPRAANKRKRPASEGTTAKGRPRKVQRVPQAEGGPAEGGPAKKAPPKTAPPKKAPPKEAPAKKAPPKEAPPKKAPVKKTPAKKAPAKSKVSKVPAPAASTDKAPIRALDILVFGGGENGELGLGPKRKEALRPAFNTFLDPRSPTAFHIVDFACGGMHTIALSEQNQLITWGVNDSKALGRNTDWEGGVRDADADSSASDDDEDLNPLESTPTEIPAEHFPSGTTFTQVAAGDCCSFALTDTGLVYGWGSFRDNQGEHKFGYKPNGAEITMQETPVQIRGIPPIAQIACGADHVLALDKNGIIWVWGCNDRNQFGRQLFGRHQDTFVPTQVRLRGSVKYIASGPYHSFAVDRRGNVWGWGLNTFGQAGDPTTAGDDSATLPAPVKIGPLFQKDVTTLAGGARHSAAVTADGQCLVWGQIDYGQLGIEFTPAQVQDQSHIKCDERDKPRICLRPTPVPNIEAVHVACGTDHTIFIDKSGNAYSSGYGFQGQLGLGSNDDADVATLIEANAAKTRLLVRADAGGNRSLVAGYLRDDQK